MLPKMIVSSSRMRVLRNLSSAKGLSVKLLILKAVEARAENQEQQQREFCVIWTHNAGI